MATKIWAKDAKFKCKQNRDFEFGDLMEEISQWIKIAQQLRLSGSHQTAKVAATEVTTETPPPRRLSRRPHQTETSTDRPNDRAAPPPTHAWALPTPVSSSAPPTTQCPACQGIHPVVKCLLLARLTPDAKAVKIRDSGLCFQCLISGHISRDCPSPAICACCHGRHHTILHGRTPPTSRPDTPRGGPSLSATAAPFHQPPALLPATPPIIPSVPRTAAPTGVVTPEGTTEI